jgi:glutathione peroxidase-family protein
MLNNITAIANRTDLPSKIADQILPMTNMASSFDIGSQLSMLGNLYTDLTTYGITKWQFANDLFNMSML